MVISIGAVKSLSFTLKHFGIEGWSSILTGLSWINSVWKSPVSISLLKWNSASLMLCVVDLRSSYIWALVPPSTSSLLDFSS